MSNEGPASFSTPVKVEPSAELDSSSKLKPSDIFYIKKEENKSVEDLINTIDKNLYSTSLMEGYLQSSDNNNTASLHDESSDASPIRPLTLKQHQNLDNILGELPQTPDQQYKLNGDIMEDIPIAPSFDELEFNTRVNRTSSLSRINGPRQLLRSNICRTYSTKLPTSNSWKSFGGYSTRDNSPSKKSVCFEDSPPKVIKYNQLTPEHSDDELNCEENHSSEELESSWTAELKPSIHTLPPLPPKHVLSASNPETLSPQKDTALGSSDGSFDSENDSKMLTKNDLYKQEGNLSIEQKLDLVLNDNEIASKVQDAEYSKGSSSPKKEITNSEEELLFGIKNKKELEKEQYLRDAADMFEPDVRNNDEQSKKLRLAPQLRRQNSNNSLNDSERELVTTAIQRSTPSIVSDDGSKNLTVNTLQHAPTNDDSTSFESAFSDEEEMNEFTQGQIVAEQRNAGVRTVDSHNDNKAPEANNNPSSDDTVEEADQSTTPKLHSKKASLTGSISSGLSLFTSLGKNVKDAFHKKQDSSHFIKPSGSPELVATDYDLLDCSLDPSQHKDDDAFDSRSYQSSIVPHERKYSSTSIQVKEEHDDSEESIPLLSDSHTSIQDGALAQVDTNAVVRNFKLPPPFSLQEKDQSFSDDLKSATSFFDYSNSLASIEDAQNVFGLQSKEIFSESEPILFSKSSVKSECSSEKEITTADKILTPTITSLSPPPVHKKPFVEPFDDPEDEVSFNSLLLKQSESNNIDAGVQTESKPEKQTLPSRLSQRNTFLGSSDDVAKNLKVNQKLPPAKFDSMLFSDKDFSEDQSKAPPADYISIWHSQPKSVSPAAQYSIFQRKPTPPKKVMNILNKRVMSKEEAKEFEKQLEESGFKFEPEFSVDSLNSKRDSFVATSISKSAIIGTKSRPIVIDSSFVDNTQSQDLSLNSADIANNSNIDTAGISLPDLSTSSDFGNAFKDWQPPLDSNTQGNSEVPEESSKIDKKNNDVTIPDKFKVLWHTNSHQVRTPSVDSMKIKNLIAQDHDEVGQAAHYKSLSSTGLGNVIVSKEEHGIPVEIDQGNSTPKLNSIDSKSVRVMNTLFQNKAPSLLEPNPEIQDEVDSNTQYSQSIGQDKRAEILHQSDVLQEQQNQHGRYISGSSTKFENLFDLGEEFDRALQIKEKGYATVEPHEYVIAKSKSNDLLDEDELSKPMVPEVDNSNYVKQTQQEKKIRYNDRVPSARRRTPLGNLNESSLNSLMPSSPIIIPTSKEPTPFLNQDNEISTDFNGGEITIQKRQVQLESGQSKIIQHDPVSDESKINMPSNDLGRLYIHVDSLDGLLLDHIKIHKPSFRLVLDNEKHTIATPKLALDNKVAIDKEFEVAVDSDLTDLHFTLKVSYSRPTSELAEVYQKIPIKTKRLSRLIGAKPKYRVEKRFITRTKEFDEWDNLFATDGSFGKNKILFERNNNQFTGRTFNTSIDLYNEWATFKQGNQVFKKQPHIVGRLNLTMLYIPRVSPLETLPPSIRAAKQIANHLKEQASINMQGFLTQEGGDCSLWKRRYFKLQGTKLIAHHETSLKPRAQINLLKAIEVIYHGKESTQNQRNFTDEILLTDSFKLKFRNGEIIMFNADTREQKNIWIQKLEKVVELNRFHQPWVSLIASN